VERACQFPISGDSTQLDEFFAHRIRATLYGPIEQQSIRDVQPGWLYDRVVRHCVTDLRSRDEEVAGDDLTLVQRLSNVDEHRCLHLTAVMPDLVHYAGPVEGSRRSWRFGSPPFFDGTILGTLVDDPEHPEPLPELTAEMELRLEAPRKAANSDVAGVLLAIHQRIAGHVLPRVLNPPPQA
jgi:hypothetical protein